VTAGTARVSVVIPLYNLRRYVGEAIESVLTQTLPPEDVEIVVVDDGSTDGGAEVAGGYAPRVQLLRQEHRGLSAARNAGIAATRAPFLLFLDADDRIRPDMLAAQLTMFDAHPELGAVYTGVQCVDPQGAPLPQRGWVRAAGDVFARLVLENVTPVHTVLVRRAAVDAVGGFDETLDAAEDWDLWLRISRRGLRWACLDRPLAEYRIRTDAMHQDPRRMAGSLRRVVDKVFADPTLPDAIGRLAPLAYQRLELGAACAFYRTGDPAAGARWLRAAVLRRPAVLTERESLALFCRRLLPMGYQTGTIMAAEWRRLASTLRQALGDLFRSPGLPPEVARMRWQAELTCWRVLLPLLRRRTKAALARGGRQARLIAARERLREFERAR
jgi:hypothetical protein